MKGNLIKNKHTEYSKTSMVELDRMLLGMYDKTDLIKEAGFMLTTIKNSTLTVHADSQGAELHNIEGANGISYLWNGDPAYWHGRAPILFPIVGSLRNNIADSAAGKITLGRHGFARHEEWKLDSSDEQSMSYVLKSNEELLKNYPYPFEARVKYSLGQNSLTVSFTVLNTGKQELPYCFGGHPAFRVPLAGGELYEDYLIEFEQPETADCPQPVLSDSLIDSQKRNRLMTDKKAFRLNHILFRGDALIFDQLKSRSAKLYSEKSGHGVKIDFKDMNYFGVWSPFKDSPFVCLEPWTGMCTLENEDDVFEHKIGMRKVAPGKEDTLSFTITVF